MILGSILLASSLGAAAQVPTSSAPPQSACPQALTDAAASEMCLGEQAARLAGAAPKESSEGTRQLEGQPSTTAEPWTWRHGAQRGSHREGEWREYGGDAGGMKYSPLSQITKDNIQDLRVVWRWPSSDRAIQIANPMLRSTRNEDPH